MIREGEALLVTRAEDVIDEAGPLRLPVADTTTDPAAHLRGAEADVYAALPAIGSRLPLELAQQSGLDLATVRAVLPGLELADLAGCDSDGWFRTRGRGRK